MRDAKENREKKKLHEILGTRGVLLAPRIFGGQLKMLLLPSVYSSPERCEIKTPFKRKVTERGFLGLVYQEPIFSMEQNLLECTVLSKADDDDLYFALFTLNLHYIC